MLTIHKGKRIRDLSLLSGITFVIQLQDGGTVTVSDQGQDCCERRYMHTDDPLDQFLGATLLDIEQRDGPSQDMDYDVQESAFVAIKTDRGTLTLNNYNEHNGYYGGFDIRVVEK